MAGSDGGDHVSVFRLELVPSDGPHERHPDDFYATPGWAVRAILPYLPHVSAFDPCAGDGAIVAEMCDAGWSCAGVELDFVRASVALDKRGVEIVCGDGLARISDPDVALPLVVMNPPYRCADEWVRKAVNYGRTVAALLRLNFLGTQGRAELFAAVGIPDTYVLSKRPSFLANGATEATEYAWFVWGPGRGGRIQRLEVP